MFWNVSNKRKNTVAKWVRFHWVMLGDAKKCFLPLRQLVPRSTAVDVFKSWQVHFHCSNCARCHPTVTAFADVSFLHYRAVRENVILAAASGSPSPSFLPAALDIQAHFSVALNLLVIFKKYIHCPPLRMQTTLCHVTLCTSWAVNAKMFPLNFAKHAFFFLNCPKSTTLWEQFTSSEIVVFPLVVLSVCSFSLRYFKVNGKTPTAA